MKVVHVISSFGPGGAEILVKDIALRTDRSINVEVWAIGKGEDPEFEKRFREELSAHNIGYADVGKTANKDRLWVLFRMRELIRQRKPDVINSHSELATFYIAPALIGTGIKLVQTIHNTVIMYTSLQKYYAKHFVDKYAAISARVKRLIIDVLNVPESRVELVYNGIDVKRFQHRPRIINNEVKNIFAVGRLNVQKDFHNLLRAYAILKDRLIKENRALPALNIAGVGPQKDELIALAGTLDIFDEVNFLGARNDVPDLLYTNDMWVMSSRWEGLSIALLEASASGIPIIATDVGSNNEVIENGYNGTLVEKENPEALASEMYNLMVHPALRRMYSENARKYSDKFDINNCVAGYTNLYYALKGQRQEILSLTDSE